MEQRGKLSDLITALRPHHWVKNLLLFVVPVTAHLANGYTDVLLGFVSFCFLASAVYICNDLVDVEADRTHAVKKKRPIAQ